MIHVVQQPAESGTSNSLPDYNNTSIILGKILERLRPYPEFSPLLGTWSSLTAPRRSSDQESSNDSAWTVAFLKRYKHWRNYISSKQKPGQQPKPVHCELVLAQHFKNENLKFFMDERYIGCSRPACYTCHAYLTSHPENYVEPETSNIIYYSLLPAIERSKDAGKDDMSTWIGMQEKVERDIIDMLVRIQLRERAA